MYFVGFIVNFIDEMKLLSNFVKDLTYSMSMS
jgi:hypothetical protein